MSSEIYLTPCCMIDISRIIACQRPQNFVFLFRKRKPAWMRINSPKPNRRWQQGKVSLSLLKWLKWIPSHAVQENFIVKICPGHDNKNKFVSFISLSISHLPNKRKTISKTGPRYKPFAVEEKKTTPTQQNLITNMKKISVQKTGLLIKRPRNVF